MAKVPLQYQVSEYDCVPTTFINALAYLFDRRSIPPLVIRHIYIYSLDSVSSGGRIGIGGTSSHAIRLLGHWLGAYKTRKFSVSTEYLEGEQVHLQGDSKIISCLRDAKGVALCHIHLGGRDWHYILATELEKGWVHAFDPYWRQALRGLDGKVCVLKNTDGRSPNVAIKRDWLDSVSNQRRFCLGTRRNRECLLMWREK